MIVFSFAGQYDGGNSLDQVNVLYTPDTNYLQAILNTGGTPKISYSQYVPNKAEGTLIWESTEGVTKTSIYFKPLFPFAYSVVQNVAAPPAAVIVINSVVVTPQTAPGTNDGTATVNASGGAGPYQYSINGVDYQAGNVFTELSPGDYIIFVKSNTNPLTKGVFSIIAAATPDPGEEPAIKDIRVLAGGVLSTQNAYKRVEVLTEFGNVPSLLYNGDFEAWDGHNFAYWTRYNGLNFSRIQRTVKNFLGAEIPIENYALQFDEPVNLNKYLQSNPIPIRSGETAKVQYRVSKTDTFTSTTQYSLPGNISATKTLQTYYVLRMRIYISDGPNTPGSYLSNGNEGGNDYKWDKALGFVYNIIENPLGDLNNFTFNFSIPEAPYDGDLTIYLFGFNKVLSDTVKVTGGKLTDRPEKILTYLDEYRPISIDDLTFTKSSKSKDDDITGVLSVSENLGFYTEKPERIPIMFGDIYRTFKTISGPLLLDSLYAIKVGQDFSTGWYEYGTTTSPVPFSLALAKSILRAYQKPFRFWTGNMKLAYGAEEISYMNTISFDVPGQLKFSNKVFAIMGVDIDLKYNTMNNLLLAEIFDRPAKSNDISVPNSPGSSNPVFVQDPNGELYNYGIFTEEFTQEFS